MDSEDLEQDYSTEDTEEARRRAEGEEEESTEDSIEVEDFSVEARLRQPRERLAEPQNFSEFEREYKATHNQIARDLREADEFGDLQNDPAMKALQKDFKVLDDKDEIKPAGLNAHNLVGQLERLKNNAQANLEKLKKPNIDPRDIDDMANRINALYDSAIAYAKQKQAYLAQERENTTLQKELGNSCTKIGTKSISGSGEEKWRQMSDAMKNLKNGDELTLEFGSKDNKCTVTKTKDGKLHIKSTPPNAERDMKIAAAHGLSSITIDANSSNEYKIAAMEAAKKHGITVRNPPDLKTDNITQKLGRVGTQARSAKDIPGLFVLDNARYKRLQSANDKLASKSSNDVFRKDIPENLRDAQKCIDLMSNGAQPAEARAMLDIDPGYAKPEDIVERGAKLLLALEARCPRNVNDEPEIFNGSGRNVHPQELMKEMFSGKKEGQLLNDIFTQYEQQGGKLKDEFAVRHEVESEASVDEDRTSRLD